MFGADSREREDTVQFARTLVWKSSFILLLVFFVGTQVLLGTGLLNSVSALPLIDVPLLDHFSEERGVEVSESARLAASNYCWVFMAFTCSLVAVPVCLYSHRMRIANLREIDKVTGVPKFGVIVAIILGVTLAMNLDWLFSGIFDRDRASLSIDSYVSSQILAHALYCGFMTWLSLTILATASINATSKL